MVKISVAIVSASITPIINEIGSLFSGGLSRVAGNMTDGSRSCLGIWAAFRPRRCPGWLRRRLDFCSSNWGEGAGKAVGTFARLVARSGPKNVPTHVEIIAELPACHAGGRDGRQKSHIGVVSFRATPSSVYALPVVNASDIFCGGDLVGSIEHLDV